MMGKWISGDGRWAVEPMVLDGRPCYRVMGPGMRGPEYVHSDAELKQRLGGDVMAMLIDPDEPSDAEAEPPLES
jgi:hypothetical protein